MTSRLPLSNASSRANSPSSGVREKSSSDTQTAHSKDVAIQEIFEPAGNDQREEWHLLQCLNFPGTSSTVSIEEMVLLETSFRVALNHAGDGWEKLTMVQLSFSTASLVKFLISVKLQCRMCDRLSGSLDIEKEFVDEWRVFVTASAKAAMEIFRIAELGGYVDVYVNNTYALLKMKQLSKDHCQFQVSVSCSRIRTSCEVIESVLAEYADRASATSHLRISIPVTSIHEVKLVNQIKPTPINDCASPCNPPMVKTVMLSKKQVSFLIGIKGARINAIRQNTGCQVKIFDVPNPTLSRVVRRSQVNQQVKLTGTSAQINSAHRLMQDYLVTLRDNDGDFM